VQSQDQTDEDIPEGERDALLAIAHGALVTSGGVSIQRALSVTVEATLTRGLGISAYGVYAFAWRITTMCLRFANLGANTTLLRDVSAFSDEPARQRRSLGLSYLSTAVGASVIAASLFLAADWINGVTVENPLFPPVLRLFAGLLVAFAFVRLHVSALKASKSANGEVLLNRVVSPLTRLVAVSLAVALGYSVVGIAGLLVAAVGTLAVAAYPATTAVTGIRPSFHGLRSEARHFYDHAVPSALSNVGGLLRTRVDVLLIGVLLTEAAAGIYNVVLLLVGIAAIPLIAFNQLMPPVASDLYSDGEVATLNDVYTTISRLIVTATVPFVVVLAVYGKEILAVFGPEFRRGYPVLLVFLVGRLVGNGVGATGILLSMTNNHYPKMVLEWILAVLNVVLTFFFVVEFGLIGAALGTSLAIAVQNLLQATVLWWADGLWPFDGTFLKPLGAGVGMAGAMLGVGAVVSGPLAVAPGTLVGLAAFFSLLGAAGYNRKDRFVTRELLRSYRFAVGRFLNGRG